MAAISLTTLVVASKNQVSAHLGDEAVILHLEDGVYFGLNQLGASIWHLLESPRTVAEIREAIMAEYEVEPQRCEQDLLHWLKELQHQGLIEILEG